MLAAEGALCVCASLCDYVYLFLCISVYLFCVSLRISVCRSVSLCISLYLCVYLSVSVICVLRPYNIQTCSSALTEGAMGLKYPCLATTRQMNAHAHTQTGPCMLRHVQAHAQREQDTGTHAGRG